MLKYKLSPQAKQDLLDIFLFGIKKWGQEQAENYANELLDCLELLVKNPEIGLKRPELHENIQSFANGSHIIFYRKVNSIIEIATILHQKMDIGFKFK